MSKEETQNRMLRFKNDLQREDTESLVQRYITHGNPAILSEDSYFSLKNVIAKKFNVHPSAVYMVGSGKLGFSIKPKRRFMPFCDTSDLDLAIVSTHLFEEIWQEIFSYRSQSGYWPKEREFQQYLFRGWIRPDFMPPTELTKEWWEFFRGLTESGQFGPYKITAGVYHSFFFFESYQSICIDQCKNEVI